MNKKELIYLATPYSSDNPYIVEKRYLDVTYVFGVLLRNGLQVLSPVTMCHPISHMIKLPGNWEFWKKIDESYLSRCNTMYILKVDGWDKSSGVKGEIQIAKKNNIPICFLDFDFEDDSYVIYPYSS